MDKIETYINDVIAKYDRLPPLLSAILYFAGSVLGIIIGAKLSDICYLQNGVLGIYNNYIYSAVCIILIPIIMIAFCLCLWRVADAFKEKPRRLFHRLILVLMMLDTLAFLIMLPGIIG